MNVVQTDERPSCPPKFFFTSQYANRGQLRVNSSFFKSVIYYCGMRKLHNCTGLIPCRKNCRNSLSTDSADKELKNH